MHRLGQVDRSDQTQARDRLVGAGPQALLTPAPHLVHGNAEVFDTGLGASLSCELLGASARTGLELPEPPSTRSVPGRWWARFDTPTIEDPNYAEVLIRCNGL